MTVKDVKNKAASVHQRLLNMARSAKRPFNELLQYYAMERFLHRLSESQHRDGFVLKGALMLTAWKAPDTRPTMDIDLLGYADNDLKNLEKIVRDVCRQSVSDDGLRFDPKSIRSERIKEDADYEGVRVRFTGYLGNAKVPMQIDVAFGDVVTPKPKKMSYPSILGDKAPKLKAYNRESVVAEKFEAMVKLGELNTRMKDFFDVWYLSRQFDFQGDALLAACRATFDHRQTSVTARPTALSVAFSEEPRRQTMWAGFLKKSRIDYAPDSFKNTVTAVRRFLAPIARNLVAETDFDQTWPSGGPWTSSAGRKRD